MPGSSIGKSEFKCSKCGQVMQSQTELQEHQKTHKGQQQGSSSGSASGASSRSGSGS